MQQVVAGQLYPGDLKQIALQCPLPHARQPPFSCFWLGADQNRNVTGSNGIEAGQKRSATGFDGIDADQRQSVSGSGGTVMQAAVEELRGLRAAEESALTALADEELAARFNGDVTLTVRDDAVTVLSPDQVGPTSDGHCVLLLMDP